jgi:hypothetical protein
MQESGDKIQESIYPLCGFGGQQVLALGELAMPITFGYVNNTRTEEVVFELVDMEFSYNATVERGTLNAFESVLHSSYLCMMILSNQGIISVYGSQEATRRVEGTLQDPKIVYIIDEAEVQTQASEKQVKEKASSTDQPKSIMLCEDVADQRVLFGSQLSSEQEINLKRFLFYNKNDFAWSTNDLCGVYRSIIEHALNVDSSIKPRKQKL